MTQPLALLPMLGLLACTAAGPQVAPDVTDDTAEASTGPEAHEPEHLFTFGLLADSHVTGTGDHLERLGLAVDALEAEATDLAFVAVLGDIAWGGGWELARERLDTLSVPWVPVFGDNPIQVGEETGFHETFGAHLDALGPALEGWTVAPVPVTPPPEAPVDA